MFLYFTVNQGKIQAKKNIFVVFNVVWVIFLFSYVTQSEQTCDP